MNDLLTRAVANVIPRTLAEEKLNSGKKLRVYLGIDPTGSKLHLGHTVPLRKLQAFAAAGHEAIFLVGSFTAMIGDPSGRDTQREPLTAEQVKKNFETYKKQASKAVDFGKIEVRCNHEWLEGLSQKDLLKIASRFTKQQMEQRDMFERREKEGNPIHLHEMLYPLYVGYDSVILDVDCEIGGSDQEFNMLCGRTLQKAYGKREKFVLTTHLIPGLDGRKMSKTYENCIYLDDPPGDMYGKLMSLDDSLIPLYMECCTDIPMQEVAEASVILSGAERSRRAKNLKMRLAREIVSMYHGKDAAAKAEAEFEKVFKGRGVPDDVPEIKVEKGESLLIVDVLVKAKLVSSKSEARRLIKQGAIEVNWADKKFIYVNYKKKINEVIPPEAFEKGAVVKVGKRKFVRLTW